MACIAFLICRQFLLEIAFSALLASWVLSWEHCVFTYGTKMHSPALREVGAWGEMEDTKGARYGLVGESGHLSWLGIGGEVPGGGA